MVKTLVRCWSHGHASIVPNAYILQLIGRKTVLKGSPSSFYSCAFCHTCRSTSQRQKVDVVKRSRPLLTVKNLDPSRSSIPLYTVSMGVTSVTLMIVAP